MKKCSIKIVKKEENSIISEQAPPGSVDNEEFFKKADDLEVGDVRQSHRGRASIKDKTGSTNDAVDVATAQQEQWDNLPDIESKVQWLFDALVAGQLGQNLQESSKIAKHVKNIIKEELTEEILRNSLLKEGLLEDPIEQSGSVVLSMLDARGFRTRGFVETLVRSIEMEAEKQSAAANEIMEKELLNMRSGLDDLADRRESRLRTYFPIGAQAQALRPDGGKGVVDIPLDLRK